MQRHEEAAIMKIGGMIPVLSKEFFLLTFTWLVI
jgi:hypothetical protein